MSVSSSRRDDILALSRPSSRSSNSRMSARGGTASVTASRPSFTHCSRRSALTTGRGPTSEPVKEPYGLASKPRSREQSTTDSSEVSPSSLGVELHVPLARQASNASRVWASRAQSPTATVSEPELAPALSNLATPAQAGATPDGKSRDVVCSGIAVSLEVDSTFRPCKNRPCHTAKCETARVLGT